MLAKAEGGFGHEAALVGLAENSPNSSVSMIVRERKTNRGRER